MSTAMDEEAPYNNGDQLTRQEYALEALTLFNKCEYIVRAHRGLDPEPRFRGAAGRELRETILGLMNLPEEMIDRLLAQAKMGSLPVLPEIPLPPKVARRSMGRQWGIHRAAVSVDGDYSPAVVFALLGDRDLLFGGFLVSMRSARYLVFRQNPSCVTCGLTGTVFRLTLPASSTATTPRRAHFNFWGQRDGVDVMLTKDHIVPESRGGPAHPDNLQTMCADCNVKKGSKVSPALDRYLTLHEAWMAGDGDRADIEEQLRLIRVMSLSTVEARAVAYLDKKRS